MKKLAKFSVAIVALAGLSSAALAATPGIYVGAGLGYGQLEQKNIPSFSGVTTSQQKGNVTGRVFGGYNFNQNFGLEAGYNYFGQAVVKESDNVYNLKYTNQLQSADLVAKAYLPISDSGFNLYALGGAAYVHSSEDLSGNVVSDSDSTTGKVRPKYGVGVSYDVPNSSITTSLELSRVQGTGSDTSIPNVDSALLTISYNFD